MATTQTNRNAGIRTSAAQKGPCIVASLTALTLSGEQTVDGEVLTEGDRVLYALAGGSADNGIYIVSTGEWERAPDFNRSDDVVEGTAVRVTRGTNSGVWVVSNQGDITIGTTVITFTQDVSLLGDALLASQNLGDLDDVLTGWKNLQGVEDTVASAATIDLSASDVDSVYVLISGSVTISAITMGSNDLRILEFTGAPQITVGASLVGNNGGQNIQIEAGDWAIVKKKPGGKVSFIHLPVRRRAPLKQKGTAVASAATVTMPMASYVHITGTTTISDVDFLDATDGNWIDVEFDSALTLTHSANLKCPGSQDLNVSAGDVVRFIQDSGDTVKVVALFSVSATGTIDEWLPAGAFIPQITSGPSAGVVEIATSLIPLATLDFDATSAERAVCMWRPPKRWNGGTITAEFLWTAASGSGGVAWGLDAVAFSNDDALSGAYGTQQVATDTLITANDQHVTSTTAAVTIAGSPLDADLVALRVSREPANGSDTLAVDAKLIGVAIHWTSNSGNDA